jgi:N-methylhydantoinase A/oxoprolinase/acetone carboxylase beta subunit
MDTSVPRAAWGIKRVVDSSMTQASRIHASERGIDLRRFDMIAFGGAGPMHAAFIARELNVSRVVVPAGAGVASAIGLLVADVEFHVEQTEVRTLESGALERLNEIYDDLEARGAELAERAGNPAADLVVTRTADMKYQGQAHDITIEIPSETLTEADIPRIRERFDAAYADAYGYSNPAESLAGVTWKVTVRRQAATPEFSTAPATGENLDPVKGTREAYFDTAGGFVETDIYDRRRLAPGDQLAGPAIIEEQNATTVVPPGDEVRVDDDRNLVLSVQGGVSDGN